MEGVIRLVRSPIALVFLSVIALIALTSSAFAQCSNPPGVEGRSVYNTTTKQFQYCDGLDWIAMTRPGSGSGGCINPLGVEGRPNYNPSYRVLQGCAGDQWRAMGPTKTPSPFTDGQMISGGGSTGKHVCAIKTDKSLWCWGDGVNGKLGNGGTAQQNAPVEVSESGPWVMVSAGVSHTCALKEDGTAWCWGSGANGKLGNNASSQQNNPVQVTGSGAWKYINAGAQNSCGVKQDGTGWCWGKGGIGTIGNGSVINRDEPFVVSQAGPWKLINVGNFMACGVKEDGSGWCWGGYGVGGTPGDGSTGGTTSPVQIAEAGPWETIIPGMISTDIMGVKTDGSVWQWGFSSNTPELVYTSPSGQWKKINQNGSYTYLIQNSNASGMYTFNAAVFPLDGGYSWFDVTAVQTKSTVCGIRNDATIWCRGEGDKGELGDGNGVDNATFVQVSEAGPWGRLCLNPVREEGALTYNSSSKVMQYCDGVSWVGIGVRAAVVDLCAGSPTPGDVCADGTVYAGLSPDGNVKMYVTRCDAGMSWSGATCTGTRSLLSWNNGTSNWTTTGYVSGVSGQSNSAGLAALSDAGSPYYAAQYCEGLSQDGHTDWYLPAKNELDVIYGNKDVIAQFYTSEYWSSTETSANTFAWRQRFSDGSQNYDIKDSTFAVRCARR